MGGRLTTEVIGPPEEKRLSLAELLERMHDVMVLLERSLAGFSTWAETCNSLNMPPGAERRRGIPLATMPGSVDGVNCVETVLDVGKAMAVQSVTPAEVLALAGVIRKVFEGEVRCAFNELLKLVSAMAAILSPPAAAPG